MSKTSISLLEAVLPFSFSEGAGTPIQVCITFLFPSMMGKTISFFFPLNTAVQSRQNARVSSLSNYHRIVRLPFLLWLFPGNPKSAFKAVYNQGGICLDRQSSDRRHLLPLGKWPVTTREKKWLCLPLYPVLGDKFCSRIELTGWVYLTREISHIGLHKFKLGKGYNGCLHAGETKKAVTVQAMGPNASAVPIGHEGEDSWRAGLFTALWKAEEAGFWCQWQRKQQRRCSL